MVEELTATLPQSSSELAGWFAEAVRSEIAALEKDGGEQAYEVLSGTLIEDLGDNEAIFQFILADGTRLPEEATGKLKTQGDEFNVSVVAQTANRIHLELMGKGPLPSTIPRGTLLIDDTALLRKLAETLEECKTNPAKLSALSSQVFHPETASTGNLDLIDSTIVNALDDEKRRAIEKACGSSVTYVWGPPGTGKTHLIARLIAVLLQKGERVLVTSHTHAAVDQALYASVKEGGPLAGSEMIGEGLILRVGLTKDKKIPDTVRLDKVLEQKAKELETKIAELESEAAPLARQRAAIRPQLEEWQKLSDLRKRLEMTQVDLADNEKRIKETLRELDSARDLLQIRRGELEKAQRAWFRRAKKTENATRLLESTETDFRGQEAKLESLQRQIQTFNETLQMLQSLIQNQEVECSKLASLEELKKQELTYAQKLDDIEKKIDELRILISDLANKLIANSRAIFCTLTKLYVAKELFSQTFDGVIIDEISMALPPLVFLAAGRGSKRVILVGDFKQLPPIIRSDSEISNTRLREDTFHLAGVAKGLEPVKDCKVLTALRTQRRMVPQIADVARHLTYGPDGIRDHPDLLDSKAEMALGFLPASPLVIVDTAELHCWSGKQPGTRSRFNFYSAMVAAELSAMVACELPEPDLEEPQPIGIITPYAAQRRMLSKIIEGMGLNPWVAVGTVHTFQGGEAKVIIFDSVVDEPHWSSRLSNPKSEKDVIRDLNVAVTRAQNKFILIGSSDWLNARAKVPSGLGILWSFLKAHSALVSAIDLVENGFMERVSKASANLSGWQMPLKSEISSKDVLEILDETNFFGSFAADLDKASKSVFGLVPYFGEYRWPQIQPFFATALMRGVEVTLLTPPPSEADKAEYVEKAIKNLREMGAVVEAASGLHGKDIIIDEHILYTGSLNWASHRGRSEIMHRIESPGVAKLALKYLQAKYIRDAAVHPDGTPRTCPDCGGPTWIINLSGSKK